MTLARLLNQDPTDGNLKPYLGLSGAVHLGILAAVWLTIHHSPPAPSEVYRIDFIGPTAGILNRIPDGSGPSAGQASAPAPVVTPPQIRTEEFRIRPSRRGPLPRPSILGRLEKMLSQRQEAPPKVQQSPASPAPPTGPSMTGSAEGGEGTSVSADLPNFPYPWYITQVRSALWAQWSTKTTQGGGEVTVMFSIRRNGQVVDLRVESSSGDKGLDFLALSSVQESSPFPPLPRAFTDPFLKVHVHFK